jgi:hypothetical protein
MCTFRLSLSKYRVPTHSHSSIHNHTHTSNNSKACDQLVQLIKDNGRWVEPPKEEEEEQQAVAAVA